MSNAMLRFVQICAIVAALSAQAFHVLANQPQQNCFVGDRTQALAFAEAQRKTKCSIVCQGCGCKGGPGYREVLPNDSIQRKSCVTFEKLQQKCGPPPYSGCTAECVPIDDRCNRASIFVGPPLVSKIGDSAVAIEITGHDRSGKAAAFDLIQIGEGFKWEYKSIVRFDGGQDQGLFIALLRERIGSAENVIAVGTASHEGHRAQKERRAFERAETLLEWLRPLVGDGRKLWTLNLGQSSASCAYCDKATTSSERPVIVIGVGEVELGVSLPEALRSAWERIETLPALNRYSMFALERAN